MTRFGNASPNSANGAETSDSANHVSLSRKSVSRRGFFGAVAGTGLVLAAAACGKSDSGSDSSSGASASSASSSGEKASSERVVALNTGQIDGMLTLGIVPVGMGVAKASASASDDLPDYIKSEFSSKYDLGSITVVGQRTSPDLEKIAQLKPTLILANEHSDEKLLEQLKAIAPVVTGKGGAENWKSDYLTIAEAVGQKSKAESLIKDYEDKAAEWKKSRNSSPTVSLVRNKGDEYLTMGQLSLAGQVLEDTGFKRPANQVFNNKVSKSISRENIDTLNADYLFYGLNKQGQKLTQEQLWKDMPVVKNNHAISVDTDAWYLNASVVAANFILNDLKKYVK